MNLYYYEYDPNYVIYIFVFCKLQNYEFLNVWCMVFPTNVIISHSTKNNANYLSYDINVAKYDLVTHTELYSNKIVGYYI